MIFNKNKIPILHNQKDTIKKGNFDLYCLLEIYKHKNLFFGIRNFYYIDSNKKPSKIWQKIGTIDSIININKPRIFNISEKLKKETLEVISSIDIDNKNINAQIYIVEKKYTKIGDISFPNYILASNLIRYIDKSNHPFIPRTTIKPLDLNYTPKISLY